MTTQTKIRTKKLSASPLTNKLPLFAPLMLPLMAGTLSGCFGPDAQNLTTSGNTPVASSVVTPMTPVPVATATPGPSTPPAPIYPSCVSNLQGVTQNFNVLVFGNFTAPSSDVGGGLAAGGNVTIGGYSVGAELPLNPSRTDLVVGNNLVFNGGAVVNGSIAYGGTASLQSATAAGTVTQSSPISFTSAQLELNAISQSLAGLTPNMTAQIVYYSARAQITLNATNSVVNVFSISPTDLANTDMLTVNAPAGSTVVINSAGTNVSLSNFAMYLNGGVTGDHIFFNFPTATSLNIQDIAVEGAVLAPLAALNFPTGEVDGQVVASSANGSGQYNNIPFAGCLPVPSGLGFAKDSSIDSTDGYTIGGTNYEMYGMAVRQIGDTIIVGLNSNFPLNGENEDGVHIGWGDVVMNFSPNLASYTAAVENDLYAAHFVTNNNGAGVQTNGIYSNPVIEAVETSHAGWPTYGQYTSFVTQYGGVDGLGNVNPFTYFDANSPVPNEILSGNLLSGTNFTMLGATDLTTLGIDFAAAFGIPANQLGSQSVGFAFRRPSGMTGNYVMHVAPECANDVMAIQYKLQ